MSLQFSNTTSKNGIIQRLERVLGFQDGDISGNSLRLAYFTGDVNVALDEVFAMIFEAGGTWQFDDSNHTDLPFITTDIVSGQRDYSFLTDGSGNLILDIHRVMVADSTGVFREIEPIDIQTPNNTNVNTDTLIDGQNRSGVPTRYDKTGNSILLDLVPNYNYDNGLKVFTNREGSYFATTDTTKKAGFAGTLHEYLVLQPAYKYARDKQLDNLVRLEKDVLEMREAIKKHYGKRERDISRRLQARVENNK